MIHCLPIEFWLHFSTDMHRYIFRVKCNQCFSSRVVTFKMLLQALLVFTFCAQIQAYYPVNLKNVEPSLQAEAKYKHWHLPKIQSTDSGPFNYEMCKTRCFHPRMSYRLWLPKDENCPPQITHADLSKVMLQEYPKHTPANVCLKKVTSKIKYFIHDKLKQVF